MDTETHGQVGGQRGTQKGRQRHRWTQRHTDRSDRQRDSVRAKSRDRHTKRQAKLQMASIDTRKHILQATNKRRDREMKTHTRREENRRDKYSKRQTNKEGDIHSTTLQTNERLTKTEPIRNKTRPRAFVQNQHAREIITTRKTSHEHNNKDLSRPR